MTEPTPTVVLVHGAFAESASWNPVIERLQRRGAPLVANPRHVPCDVVAVANPLRSLAGDAAYVRDVMASIDGPIVLVGHSYGGLVVTEAAAGSDAVVALVYVAAFAPETGESAFQMSSQIPGSTLGEALAARPVSSGGDELAIRPELFHEQFCADVSSREAELMAATQRPVTQAALTDPLVAPTPAWKRIPSWFVFGEADRNIPAALTRFQADRAGARAIHELPGASHAISVSRPDAVASTILEAMTAAALDPVG